MNIRDIASWTLLFFALTLLIAREAAAQEGPLNTAQPNGITVDQIVQKFAAKEKQFRDARENYTWHQSVRVQTLDGDTPDGEYHSEADVVFDNKGKRIERITFAPQSTLERIMMTREDFEDIEKRMPFTVTSEDLPEYNINYVGQQKEDELNTYVFDISPKQMQKGKRYFEGRIWVDDQDFQIVKSYGKNVPDVVQKHGQENLFPKFTTWRQQVDGKYWFPAYTRVDDTLHVSTGYVHVRQIIKYTDYHYFGAKTKITFEGQEVEQGSDAKPDQQNQNPPQNPKK